jgi:zinc transport system permease protein
MTRPPVASTGAAFMFAAADWLDQLLHLIANQAPSGSFFAYGYTLRALIALILVSLCCGAVGSLVVGGRMAFFSDALAHCAFASVSIGFVLFTTLMPRGGADQFWNWVTPVMLSFGVLIGYSIASVRERTGLTSDTVIGVFFAGAIGLAAMLRKVMQNRQLFSLEDFLFGDPLLVRAEDVLWLGLLTVVVGVTLVFIYNHLLLTGVSNSLALSRNVPGRLASYVFIMLLALVVNLCVRTVGVLLINALLVVPAATAANFCRNLRQLFWATILLCLVSSLGGLALDWEAGMRYRLRLGIPGVIVLISVVLFIVSIVLGPLLRDRAARST